ncbi:hypothetical protein AeRB84_004744 [Aphanomyces euteiches]|nr:hypothetical protein AeRB84_004744 [Aphanomyces euteiches]
MSPLTWVGLVLAAGGVAHASLSLTLCWSASGVQLPCLYDTVQGNTTILPVQTNSTIYNLSNLNISFIQDLPPNAQIMYVSMVVRVDFSCKVSCRIPSSLIFLNLSHNALQSNWIQTPLTVSTLDISYNQGGLSWIQNVRWRDYLPKLKRLFFRGNNVMNLRLNYDNFPMYPLEVLDLSNNPYLAITVDSRVYNRLYFGGFQLIVGSSLFANAMNACGGNSYWVRPINFVISNENNTSTISTGRWQTVYLCYPGYSNTIAPTYSYGQRPAFYFMFLGVGMCAAFVLVVTLIRNAIVKYRDRHAVFERGTICNSDCSDYEDALAGQVVYVPQPANPRQN